jgi:hypothetical protein
VHQAHDDQAHKRPKHPQIGGGATVCAWEEGWKLCAAAACVAACDAWWNVWWCQRVVVAGDWQKWYTSLICTFQPSTERARLAPTTGCDMIPYSGNGPGPGGRAPIAHAIACKAINMTKETIVNAWDIPPGMLSFCTEIDEYRARMSDIAPTI